MAFHTREKCSEFRTMEQKNKQTLGILIQIIPWKRKQLGTPFHGKNISKAFHRRKRALNSVSWNRKLSFFYHFLKMRQSKISKIVSEKTTFEVRTNHFVKLFWMFCKKYFSRYSLSFRDSSVVLGMLRNEHFLPRNNGISSKRNSVPNPNFKSTVQQL